MSNENGNGMEERTRVPVTAIKDDGLCFGCGQYNPIGLKLTFKWDGRTARAEFTPTKQYQGWSDIIHGGIIATMLDEAMGHAALYGGFSDFLTAKLQVNYKRPAVANEPLVITASVVKNEGKSVRVEAAVSLPDGTLIAEGRATQIIIGTQGSLEAVIWDMDGVIADTAPYHFKAWQTVFPPRGATFTEQDFRHHFGQRDDTIIRDTIPGLSAEEVDVIAAEKEAVFRQEAAHKVKPLPGAIELLKSLKEHGLKMAIASSAPIENIELITGSLKIKQYFQTLVWGREVAEGKPSPLGFLLAAERLGVEPGNCLVIEDAVAGVAAAKRAGMKCLAVTNNHPRESLSAANLIVETLESVSVDDLAGLFNSP
jgi:beta-phosphoglucomutase family hydrolase